MMEVYNVIGIKNVNYVSKKSGKNVNGLMVYFTQPIKDGVGLSADSVFVSHDVAGNIVPGDDVKIYYNKYGNVCSIELA